MGNNNKIVFILGIDVTLTYDTIERDCVEVRKADPSYTDGIHDEVPTNGPIRYLLEKTFEGIDIGDVQFTGTVEYSSETVTGRCVSGECSMSTEHSKMKLDLMPMYLLTQSAISCE